MLRRLIQLLGLMLSVASASDPLCYSGLTEEGWKVFRSDQPNPVVSYVGDCRRPSFYEETLYFKDSQGRVVAQAVGQKEGVPIPGTRNVCDYVVTPEGLYFTRLLTNEPTRQALWLLREDGEAQLVHRFDEGSIRQLTYASGVLIFSRIYGTAEERLYRYEKGKPVPITEANQFCVSPCLDPSGERLLFSRRIGKDNFDVCLLNLETQEEQNLTQSPSASELSPVFSPDGMRVYFERRDSDLKQQIMGLDLQSGEEQLIKLPHAAIEPWVLSSQPKEGGR